MKEIKERILEFLALGKIRGSLRGKILCLVGSAGVGKTSLASSIARALNRKFSRVSLGGESDSSTLKGHRKTYIGSYPGKIIAALKECGTENCVILLDEVDKLGRSEVHGDPQSNLLEILDPEQNLNFTDNYLDFPVDLSKVLFICSANYLDNLQEPLQDRMDIIHLSSYTNNEKKEIFRRHLLPNTLRESGLQEKGVQISIEDADLDALITNYCREPGIRSLDRYTKKLVDKVAYKLATNQSFSGKITQEDFIDFLGQPKFRDTRYYESTPPGVVIGLAYTEMGGALMFLEATKSSFSNTPM